ncbi:unnamed protein product [Rotaria magnacalcarata]|uniref:Transmembrane protein 35B n=1 Tax=Rotaria magnacalcarata TaxID=392030 RepID=A0A815AIJ5_9BILA|nr:unnamed protein product [Rotaria magnacalcarata]CAF1601617.1 unnamed protein product [Rotaria magnacalcarata]CAF1980472.1 unnamed protein product [Rotaria magnacalcarata]CAF2166264.1 unnamed protein product [Rotaria magnacalcarata]CAF2250673.1 unnamed protein product [Rotaria magnacalcarata]
MASLGLHLLTIVLGLLFIVFGHIKLSPQFFPEHHEHIRNEFGKFNKEFPLHRQTGWRPYAKTYRMAVGIAEVVCGSLLLLSFAQSLANIILLMIMTNAIITFQKLNYSIEYTGVSIFISLLLVLRLILASSGSKPKQSVQAKADKKVK